MKHLVDQSLNWVLKFLSMITLLLMPVRSVMIAISVLVIADLVTGLWASAKEKVPITSNAFGRTIGKTFLYQLSIVIAFVLETYLIEGMPVVKAVAGLIGIKEGKSFFENIHRITGIDFWSDILNIIQAKRNKPVAKKRRKK